jgi:hypothetical protein
MENMSRTAGKIQLFQSPNERCNFLTQEVGEEPIDIYDANCKCLLCLKRFNLDPGIQQKRPGLVDLFQGDVNDLVGKNLPAKSTISDTSSGFSITSKDKAIMASFTAMDEEEDIDMPLDPLGLTDDEEIHNFMTTHPGFEDGNEEETEDLAPQPQPVRSDRKIVKNPPIGIPDSFIPGEWREHLDINKIEINEPTREKLSDLLDEFKNLLSCNATDC